MTSNEILKADMLDIIFDNRNKQYGAYALRKTYNNRLGAALGIALSTVLLVLFLMRIDPSSNGGARPNPNDVVVIDHIIPPDIKKADPIIPKKADPLPQMRTEKLTTIEIRRDDLVKETVPDFRNLLNSAISNIKMDGIPPTDISVVKEPVTQTVIGDKPKNTSDAGPVQREPEFPGGQQAWLNFLQKYLIAPEELEAGEKKMVSIRFSVSEEGVVNNFQIIQSAGSRYDNEVIRVLKKMPKWKPAIQNGQPVARAFTQPVTFMGVEQ
jgi:periplasmic protein TonB